MTSWKRLQPLRPWPSAKQSVAPDSFAGGGAAHSPRPTRRKYVHVGSSSTSMSPMVGRGERATPPQRHVVADGRAVSRQLEASAHSLPRSERALRSCAPALLISCRLRRSFKEVACSRPDRPSETWMSTMSLQGRTCGRGQGDCTLPPPAKRTRTDALLGQRPRAKGFRRRRTSRRCR